MCTFLFYSILKIIRAKYLKLLISKKENYFQVLYHLTQLTSVVSPKSTSFSVKVKRQNELKKSMNDISSSNLSDVR